MFMSKKFTTILVLFCMLQAISGQIHKWHKKGKHVNIHYAYDKATRYTTRQTTLIRKAMNEIEKHTCIRFHKQKNEKDYIRFYAGRGCVSFVGKVGGRQDLSLNKHGCMGNGLILHELVHAIGFNHMHERFDRDKYITIKYKNIDKANKRYFWKLNNRNEAYKTKYDLLSVMHYQKNAFSKNRKDTIVTKKRSYRNKIGMAKNLSKGDIQRINGMYKCSKKK